MKTFVLVVIMIAVALAAGGSFFVRPEAQEAPSGRLDVDCPMTALASGVDTLRSCR